MCPRWPSTFVISLPGETARRETVTEKLNALGIPFAFFDAVDGRGFDITTHPAYDRDRRLRCVGRDLGGGEIGCLLSHKALYEKIAAENIPLALILEDDVLLEKDFKPVVESLVPLSGTFDIVRFMGHPKVAYGKHRKIRPLYKQCWLVRLRTTPGGAHAYLVTAQGARKILRHMDCNAFPIDTLLGRSWETGLNVLAVLPGLADQDIWNFTSAIGEDRFDKSRRRGLTYALNRARFKLAEAVGKAWAYWSRWPQDRLAASRAIL